MLTITMSTPKKSKKQSETYYHGGRSQDEIPYKQTFADYIKGLTHQQIEEALAHYYSHVALGFLGYANNEGFTDNGPWAFEMMNDHLGLPDEVLEKIEEEAREIQAREKINSQK